MKTQNIFTIGLTVTLLSMPAFSQDDKGSALPVIPSVDPLAKTTSEAPKNQRALVNPLQIIKEKEENQKRVNKTNIWRSSEYEKELEEKKKTDEEDAPEVSEVEQFTPSQEDIIDSLEETETENVEAEVTVESIPEDAEETKTGKTTKKSNLGNNNEDNIAKAKPKKKSDNSKAIKELQAASKNIKKPTVPDRLWSVE